MSARSKDNPISTASCNCTSATSSAAWDLAQERQFLENLLCQRFDFLLVFYSLIVAAAFTATEWRNAVAALVLGMILCFMSSLPIARAQYRLDVILDHLEELETSALRESRELAEANQGRRAPGVLRLVANRSQRRWVGYYIPAVCWISLLVCLLLVLGERLGPQGH